MTSRLFEVSWEACNQVGGIYTVLRTKAPLMVELFGDRYTLIGPYNPEQSATEVEISAPPPELAKAFSELHEAGLTAYYGRWLVAGKPQIILLDFRSRFLSLDRDKYFLFNDEGIQSPESDFEVNNSIAFGFSVAELLRCLNSGGPEEPMVAHFHEWQTGVGLLRAHRGSKNIRTIFTTHATLLGRYLASNNSNFYERLSTVQPFVEARQYNIEARFKIERQAAQTATWFSTISDITAEEAKKFLDRQPSHILPNGINTQQFVALHEFQNLHRLFKERLHEFVMAQFFPSYTFNLDTTLYFFISGRYEYRNKGMEIFIEALHILNQRLKKVSNAPTIVAFIITRAQTKGINNGALQKKARFDELKRVCGSIERELGTRIVQAASLGALPSYEELLPPEFQSHLKRLLLARRTKALPSVTTHDMVDDAGDPVLRHLRHRNLVNLPDDPVKVVFHPDFLSSTNTLLNLEYDEFVRGCHLGVFPSYYEPWGYTPLECMALGVPAVTTDLSGFGSFALQHIESPRQNGLQVLSRSGRVDDSAIDQLTDYMFKFCQLTRRERIELRNRAERVSNVFDWSRLINFYEKLYRDAGLEVDRQIPEAEAVNG